MYWDDDAANAGHRTQTYTQKKDRDQFERLIQTCWISEIAYACTKYPIITTVNLFLFLWQKKKNEKKKPTDRWFGNTATPHESPFNVGFFCSNFHIFCYKNIREFAVKIEKSKKCICFESIGGCARECMEINRKMKNKIIENWLCRQANFQRWWIPAKMVLWHKFFFLRVDNRHINDEWTETRRELNWRKSFINLCIF